MPRRESDLHSHLAVSLPSPALDRAAARRTPDKPVAVASAWRRPVRHQFEGNRGAMATWCLPYNNMTEVWALCRKSATMNHQGGRVGVVADMA